MFPFDESIKPMKARAKVKPPEPPGWVYEPKWDGFRMIAWSGAEPRLESRNGKDLLRYFPELVAPLQELPAGTIVDGEVVVVRSGVTDFDALQMRIHPAESRINMLAAETPAKLIVFDVLAHDSRSCLDDPYSERRALLEEIFVGLGAEWHLTPVTGDIAEAERWFHEFEAAGCDGIICKNTAEPYVPGKRNWVKWKHRRSVDCVVGGYRIHKDGDKIGSLLLGLYNEEGQLHFFGHCSGFTNQDRVEILQQFEQFRSEESFGDEARRPGSESRWSAGKDSSWIPVTPGVVIEISYDQLQGNRFRHATRFERWRPDKDAVECSMDQLERPTGASFGDVVG
ncbi:MAG: ATP-dependent DNA ligase [bacterium]|nr:ATP-dependent DNA ligase [bacterium]MCP4963635.1 ATP-dependent DNA ligase [bacterium]